jgi:hypothetical protein
MRMDPVRPSVPGGLGQQLDEDPVELEHLIVLGERPVGVEGLPG